MHHITSIIWFCSWWSLYLNFCNTNYNLPLYKTAVLNTFATTDMICRETMPNSRDVFTTQIDAVTFKQLPAKFVCEMKPVFTSLLISYCECDINYGSEHICLQILCFTSWVLQCYAFIFVMFFFTSLCFTLW